MESFGKVFEDLYAGVDPEASGQRMRTDSIFNPFNQENLQNSFFVTPERRQSRCDSIPFDNVQIDNSLKSRIQLEGITETAPKEFRQKKRNMKALSKLKDSKRTLKKHKTSKAKLN